MTTSPEKTELLENLNFGQRVAEDEPRLEDYFVETPLWRKILRGEVDIVYGPKGSGKSAIFHLLTSGRGISNEIAVIAAENPRGTPIFAGIKDDPPTTESEFIYMWKLYILSLIANHPGLLDEVKTSHQDLYKNLEEVGVINVEKSEMLKNALKYVDKIKIPNLIEIGINTAPQTDDKKINVDRALAIVSSILSGMNKMAWVIFDRLDSVFDDNSTLEENALRALFKAYLDILKYRNIQPKIFLRTDIWDRLTTKGFREASHITRADSIEWSVNNIVNLIGKRLLNNPALVKYYEIDTLETLSNYMKQLDLFYMVYPQQVDAGSRKPDCINWMISRVADGSKRVAPRELIHLLNQTKDEQIKSLEIGEAAPDEKRLFNSIAIKRALPTVSKVRLEQTLFSEYPDLKNYILALKGEKTEHSLKTLSGVWHLNESDTQSIASKLVGIGFFEIRGEKSDPEFWIPFLYRSSLGLIQGKAEDE